MDESKITFKIEKKVAMVTWGPPPINRIELYELATHLALVSEQFGSENKAHVIVLSGEDDNSWDFGKMLLESQPKGDRSTSLDLPKIADALAGFNGPVMAAIKGDAIGLGLELALACDLRIVSETSNFGLPQIESGKIPWDGGTQRLTRAIGPTRAMEMILTGCTIDAVEAARLGLVNKAVDKENVQETAVEMARLIAEKGPISLEYTKEAIHKGLDLTLEQGLRLEADLYYLLHTTSDREEGIKAFREKRSPDFKGE